MIPDWLIGLICTIAIAIIADYIRMKVVLTRIEWQLSRLASDRESEKETFRRVNIDIESRLRALETKQH